jgi:hypothetical protein
MLMTGFRFVSQPVTVGNTNLLDTGLSNAATIEKCTFLESGRSIVDVRSPYAPPRQQRGPTGPLLLFYSAPFTVDRKQFTRQDTVHHHMPWSEAHGLS